MTQLMPIPVIVGNSGPMTDADVKALLGLLVMIGSLWAIIFIVYLIKYLISPEQGFMNRMEDSCIVHALFVMFSLILGSAIVLFLSAWLGNLLF